MTSVSIAINILTAVLALVLLQLHRFAKQWKTSNDHLDEHLERLRFYALERNSIMVRDINERHGIDYGRADTLAPENTPVTPKRIRCPTCGGLD